MTHPTIADQLSPALREALRLASAGYGVLWALRRPTPALGDPDALVAALRELPGTQAAELAADLAVAIERVRALEP